MQSGEYTDNKGQVERASGGADRQGVFSIRVYAVWLQGNVADVTELPEAAWVLDDRRLYPQMGTAIGKQHVELYPFCVRKDGCASGLCAECGGQGNDVSDGLRDRVLRKRRGSGDGRDFGRLATAL